MRACVEEADGRRKGKASRHLQPPIHNENENENEQGTDVVFLDRFKAISQDPNDYSLVTVQGRKNVCICVYEDIHKM